jgi:hypothetical protein
MAGGHPSHPRRASLVFPAYPEGTVLDRALHRPEAQAFTPLQLLSVAGHLLPRSRGHQFRVQRTGFKIWGSGFRV